MRRMIALVFVISVLMSGCAFWMSGEYLSVQPHETQNTQQGNEIIDVTSYTQLRNTLKTLIESGADDVVVSLSDLNETTADFYVGTAINYITDNTAIGAYAVERITYEIGTNRGMPVVAFRINYKSGVTEIDALTGVASMDEMKSVITAALDDCAQTVTMMTSDYQDFDFAKFINDYANENPDKVMEIPYVNVATFPNSGKERVVEITMTYLTEKAQLVRMQQQVQSVFTSAELYVKETAKVIDIYSRLYHFLMERSEYTMETSATPSYSLLHEGIGDSRAFSNVYAAMCRRAGLECSVAVGIRNGEPWCWNVLQYRGKLYHVDLIQCNADNEFKLREGNDMVGYQWDTAAFPND